MSDPNKPREENNGQWRAVILDEFSDIASKKVALARDSTDVTAHEDKKRHHNGKICRCFPCHSPLSSQDLDTLLEINEGDIETKDVTRETGDISQAVTSIGYSEYPMHYEGPSIED